MRSSRYAVVRSDGDRAWQKHCGFFDLTTEQFAAIQDTMLLRQLRRIGPSPVATKLMGSRVPTSASEFRRLVPLSTYRDYHAEFQGSGESLPEEPSEWAHTSGTLGAVRRVPYTREFRSHVLDNLMAAFILSCSDKRGRSRLVEGDRVLYNVAPRPYLSGILAAGASRSFNLRSVTPVEEHDGLDFKEKVATGFEVSLRRGMDVLVAMTSVLVKLGREFEELSRGKRRSRGTLHPGVLYRFGRAYFRGKIEKRPILPRDLWPLKAIIGWGVDTRIYRETVREQWGVYPYELHACTEAGIMALQSWSRRDLTFIPRSNFFEFIPEQEWLRCKGDIFAQPSTVLLPELRPGERYEMVITSFHGMPFIRYRLGHLIRVTALDDAEAGIRLPQIVLDSRADDLIDIAGFTRISEQTVSQAIANAGLKIEDWSIRKEIGRERVSLRLYLELNGSSPAREMAERLQRELTSIDAGYRDLEMMMGVRPLEVVTLNPGTFAAYYTRKKGEGAELLERKPPRMNAPDAVIRELESISGRRRTVAVR